MGGGSGLKRGNGGKDRDEETINHRENRYRYTERDRQTHRETERQTDRETDREREEYNQQQQNDQQQNNKNVLVC